MMYTLSAFWLKHYRSVFVSLLCQVDIGCKLIKPQCKDIESIMKTVDDYRTTTWLVLLVLTRKSVRR
jgi:hypothetical protein